MLRYSPIETHLHTWLCPINSEPKRASGSFIKYSLSRTHGTIRCRRRFNETGRHLSYYNYVLRTSDYTRGQRRCVHDDKGTTPSLAVHTPLSDADGGFERNSCTQRRRLRPVYICVTWNHQNRWPDMVQGS